MASLSCGASCMKYILFLFNIIFFIVGAAILGVAIWLLVDPAAQNILNVINLNAGGDLMKVALYILIGIGAFIFLVGFLGCCGACRESSCMLCLYAGLLIVILVAQVAVAIMAIVFQNKLGGELKSSMQQQVFDLKPEPNDPVTFVWNTLQFNMKCCGAENFTDYRSYSDRNPTDPIPETCCRMDTFDTKKPTASDYPTCVKEYQGLTTTYTELHVTGCHKSLSDWVTKHAGILIGIAFAFALLQIVIIIFACCVRSEINNQ